MTTEAAANGNAASKPAIPLGRGGMVTLVIFGVVLPALTLLVEGLTGLCAGALFDPLPTVYHGLLIAVVPLGNLAAIVILYRRRAEHLRWLGWLNGLSMGIAAFYSLLFLPFSPFAVMLIMAGGLGLLPLSPITAFVSAIVLRRRMKVLAALAEPAPVRRVPGLWPGIILALALLIALEVPKSITAVGLQMATSDDPALEARGLSLLRSVGSRDAMLRACYVRSELVNDPLNFIINEIGRTVTEDDARIVYYRVTGTPFNAVKPPRLRAGRGGWMFDDWDFAQGGDAVQGRLRGLSLSESRLDTVVDTAGAAAYTEWTLVFNNTSARQQEARAQVILPPGGVVSRLTLWIDGEEREAAFGGRSQVKDAYKKVVQRRRDPVLVTTCGPDRILVQCFPVPPSGGTMKIRIGITSPLDLDTLNHGLLRLPYFAERNFNLPEAREHSAWLESSGKLMAADGATEWIADQPSTNVYGLHGMFKVPVLDRPLAVKVERPVAAAECWVNDPRATQPAVVRQTIREAPVAPPARLVIVIDGSRRMGEHRAELATLASVLPKNVELGVLQAGPGVEELMPVKPASREAALRAGELLTNAVFAYGCDNVPALARAWDIAGSATNSAILWLHAAQPVDLGGLEILRQKWERRPGNPVLLCAQFGSGPNVIAQGLDKIPAVRSVGRSGDMAADVRHVFGLWSGEAQALRLERSEEKTNAPPQGMTATFHVVRLWALDEILKLGASRRDEDRDRALALAQTYQLVTPLSGAVVLENRQQYQEAGLEPVSSESVPTMSVPTVPEPETWMLLAAAAAVILVAFYIRRRSVFAVARWR